MRKVKLYQRDRLIGTLEMPDAFRPPIEQAYLDSIPSQMIARSRSWLFDVRPGDFNLKLRGDGDEQEVVVIATARLMPDDIGCVIGFEPAEGCEHYAADEVLITLADDVAGKVRQHEAAGL
jgi:hypothetical protein